MPTPTKLSPMRTYAINQFWGTIKMLSKQGLIDFLTMSYNVPVDPNTPREDLIKQILEHEYGAQDIALFDPYPNPKKEQ